MFQISFEEKLKVDQLNRVKRCPDFIISSILFLPSLHLCFCPKDFQHEQLWGKNRSHHSNTADPESALFHYYWGVKG